MNLANSDIVKILVILLIAIVAIRVVRGLLKLLIIGIVVFLIYQALTGNVSLLSNFSPVIRYFCMMIQNLVVITTIL